jgi:hypothetical protein
MSAFPSNYIVNKVNDHIYKGTAISLGSTRYLALYTSNPTAADSGTEATGGSYARQSLSFAVSASGVSSSNASLTFSGMAAGTYTHYGIRDASSAGNLLVYGALPNSISANTGDDIVIPSGDIDMSLSGS